MSPEQCLPPRSRARRDQYFLGDPGLPHAHRFPPRSPGERWRCCRPTWGTPGPLLSRRPDCPPELAALVDRMMATGPGRPVALPLSEVLGSWKSPAPLPPSPPECSPPRPRAVRQRRPHGDPPPVRELPPPPRTPAAATAVVPAPTAPPGRGSPRVHLRARKERRKPRQPEPLPATALRGGGRPWGSGLQGQGPRGGAGERSHTGPLQPVGSPPHPRLTPRSDAHRRRPPPRWKRRWRRWRNAGLLLFRGGEETRPRRGGGEGSHLPLSAPPGAPPVQGMGGGVAPEQGAPDPGRGSRRTMESSRMMPERRRDRGEAREPPTPWEMTPPPATGPSPARGCAPRQLPGLAPLHPLRPGSRGRDPPGGGPAHGGGPAGDAGDLFRGDGTPSRAVGAGVPGSRVPFATGG